MLRKREDKNEKRKRKQKEEGRGWLAALGHCFVLEWNGILRIVTAVSCEQCHLTQKAKTGLSRR